MKPIPKLAEIIAVGDEMTSGQRLDTNSQWLATQLNDLGIEVGYHSTVGDDLQRQTDVIGAAMERAQVVVMTGGLGPTKDDLTRQAIADSAGVELLSDEKALAHIESIFKRNNRVMSPANQVQACYPAGGQTIHNEEGTAPGVDFSKGDSRIFAMPGVPYEMKLMWETWVGPQIAKMFGNDKVIRHRVLRCFGVGESRAESMMPDLIERDREPRVGITASYSIISFRITATADSEAACDKQIAETEAYIRETLGEVVFGVGEETLGGVTAKLLSQQELSVSFVDFQFGSAAARVLRAGLSDDQRQLLRSSLAIDGQTMQQWIDDDQKPNDDALKIAAQEIRQRSGSKIGVAVGPFIGKRGEDTAGKFPVAISFDDSDNIIVETFRFGGHSSMRETRSANQVVNFLRLVVSLKSSR